MTDQSVSVTSNPNEASADPQDPLPESNWFWRRWTFIFSNAAILALFYIALYQGSSWAGWPLMCCFALIWVIYGIAPSAEQFGKIVMAVSAMKAGVDFKTTATASTPAGTVATATTTAGKGPSIGERVETVPPSVKPTNVAGE